MEKEKVEEVDFDEVRKTLIKEVMEHPERYPDEARMILTIEVWGRQGEAFDDHQHYEVIRGEVIEVTLNEWNEGYPYRRGRRVALIPLVVPTVVEVNHYSDTTDPPIKSCTLYIFTASGWKSVKVY